MALYGGSAAAALAAPRLVDRLARRAPREAAETVVTGALIGAGFAAVAVAERVRPHRRAWNRSDGAELTDLFDASVGASAALLVASVATGRARAALGRVGAGRALRRLPLPARLGVSLVVSDLFHTSLHRLVHEWPPLWRFHSVHHSVPRLHGLNAGRFHPIEATLVMAGDGLVMAALGLDPDTAVAHRVFRTVFGQIQHGNLGIDSGPLNRILSTPERHRWHHSPERAERDTNYGSVVCLWDRAYGTDFLPTDREAPAVIGIAGLEEYPQDIVGQLLAPFRLGLRSPA
jgi:sterol desaturase/sphingolipid hydroxylase (fatty acid hydroxylase superfamily)